MEPFDELLTSSATDHGHLCPGQVIGVRMPDSVLFRVQQVQVPLNESDLPGPTRSKIPCARCGQIIRDHLEIAVNGATLCRPCANGAYFKDAREIAWPDLNWFPNKGDQPSALNVKHAGPL